MSFLYPGFLFALFAVAVPIIIHLFNFRKYKKIYFSNVRFLKEVKQESQSRNRLKQWLILMSRIFAIVCLVFAFAQPFIPGSNQNTLQKGDKVSSIYIDNSFSMNSRSREGRLLELAVRLAEQIGQTGTGNDQFQILTGDFEGKHQSFYSGEEFQNLLSEIKLSPIARPISEVVKRQKDLLNQSKAPVKRAYIISDFQHTIADFKNIQKDSAIVTQLIPLEPNQSTNISIDSCWITSPELRPDFPITLKIRISNYGNAPIENLTLQMELNGELKGPVNISVSPKSTAETEINFTVRNTGYQQGKISLSDQDILFDDKFYFAFNVLEHINVLRIRGSKSTQFIDRLFKEDPYFRYSQMNASQTDYSKFSEQHIIIMDELDDVSTGMTDEIKKFLENGGTVFIVPPGSGDLKGYNELSNILGISRFLTIDTSDSKIENIRSDNQFFDGVFESIPENMDMPVIKSSYSLSGDVRQNSETILRLRNGKKFFSKDISGKGFVYMLSVSLQENFGGFPRHAIFVPCLIKAALSSQGNHAIYQTIGNNEFVQIPALPEFKDQVFKLRKENSELEFIPEQRTLNTSTYLYLGNEITEDGIYSILHNNMEVGKVAMNYNRKESNPDFYSVDELKGLIDENQLINFSFLQSKLETFKKVLTESEEGIRLWKLFIILALVFLGIEILLIRFLK